MGLQKTDSVLVHQVSYLTVSSVVLPGNKEIATINIELERTTVNLCRTLRITKDYRAMKGLQRCIRQCTEL